MLCVAQPQHRDPLGKGELGDPGTVIWTGEFRRKVSLSKYIISTMTQSQGPK